MLGLHGFSLFAASRGYSLIVGLKFLIAVASFVASSLSVHGLQCSWCTDSDSVVAHGFSYPTACRLFPGQGLDMTPALTGRFLTSGPRGKSFITSAASAEVWLKGASYKWHLGSLCQELKTKTMAFLLVFVLVVVLVSHRDLWRQVNPGTHHAVPELCSQGPVGAELGPTPSSCCHNNPHPKMVLLWNPSNLIWSQLIPIQSPALLSLPTCCLP